jgi:hypothetical protein
MRHALAYVGAALAFAIATAAFWYNRAAFATSLPLMVFVSAFYGLSFALAIPAQLAPALDIVVKYAPTFGRRLNSGEIPPPSPPPSEPPKDGA